MNRPLGVTILAVLAMIAGILGLLGGLGAMGIGGFGAAGGEAAKGAGLFSVGLIAAVLGALQLIYGFGLWNLKRWAWTLAVVVTVLSLLNSGYSIFGRQQYGTAVGAIIGVIILIYLFRPNVKAAFGH